MLRRRWLWFVVAGVLILALVVCSRSEAIRRRLWPPAPTPTTALSVTQGQVRDAITQLPLASARLETGELVALSDTEGTFSVPSLREAEITVGAPGYETAHIRARAGFPLIVDLVPDAATTFTILYTYEQHHEFGRAYDLLHPDVQALFSRDDYIRFMEHQRPYDIVDFRVGSAEILAEMGTVLGKSYADVAQVPISATVRTGQQVTERGWLGIAVRANGLWRWFRGTLLWPEARPSEVP